MRAIAPLLAMLAALAATSGKASLRQELPSWRGPSFAHQQQLVREAQAFMEDYARRLRAGDRAAIAALYDPEGAILIRNGERTVASHAEIVQHYAGEGWRPPASFEWRDLHFEAAGAEAVVVLGTFVWGPAAGPSMTGTYHALLHRESGRLVIRIEDEAVARGGR